MRIILYTGKGGVGKTSIAAATACKIAQSGKKVLVMSTDAAHSLGDAFNVKLCNSPTQIEGNENLYAMEIDTLIENEKLWGDLKVYVESLLSAKVGKSIETEELLIFPGFEDLVSLIRIKELHDADEYDVLIVDCAPTGETMSLLKFPDIFKWWMEKFFPMKRKAAKFARPIVEKTAGIPLPDDNAFDEFEGIFNRIEALHELLLNKDVVSIRIVTTPEKIVVKEAKKSFSYLHLFDYNVDAVIINKVFTEQSSKGYFEKWINIQKESIQDIIQSFHPIPVFQLQLMDAETREYSSLSKVGELLYRDCDRQPEEILYNEKIFEVRKVHGEGYELVIKMPFVDKRELEMFHKGDELTIAIKNEKRSFFLPAKLHARQIQKAGYKDDKLIISFV